MNEGMSNPKSWVPSSGFNANGPTQRSPSNYTATVKQFEVETNPRYVRGHDGDPKNGLETYCNIFVSDVTLSMGCEIPHWVDAATGAPVAMGKGVEQSANKVFVWMNAHSLVYDWMECGERQARRRASAGFPTVVIWGNPNGIGHVAMVLPGTDFTHIAQAGGTNFFDREIHVGFGNATPLMFYTHD